MAAGVIKHERVASGESLHCERETAQLILAVRVSAGDVKENLGREFAEGFVQVLLKYREIIVVADAIGQVDVHG
jgi:hypothetical protein